MIPSAPAPAVRELSTKDIVGCLPKEVRAQFLALAPAERKLLIAGDETERELYASLPAGAAKAFAALPVPERKEEAKAGWRAKRLERKAPAAAVVASASGAARNEKKAFDVFEASARVAGAVLSIFELPRSALERVQSMAVNLMQGGCDESSTIDRLAGLLLNEVPVQGEEAPISRVRAMFSAGNTLRG